MSNTGETSARNLNKVSLPHAVGEPDEDATRSGVPQRDYSAKGNGGVEVFFKNLELALIDKIANEPASAVVGCVAWLTSIPILDALGRRNEYGLPRLAVQIVVNKEDFLRPDSGVVDSQKFWAEIRTRYDALGGYRGMATWDLSENDEYLYGDSLDGVRCAGYMDRGNARRMPKMHHKFLVFCGGANGSPAPYAVWTGSYNLTRNASRSFENAVFLRDEAIARAYYREWLQVFRVSEPLDWNSDHSNPRVSTLDWQGWSET
jgi:phosphatidylserine/phosphatidylglycerophosphate/cardiolipin synthase-like enzyme